MIKQKVAIPPIKSQGIKTKLVPWIMELVSKSEKKERWIEPFLGTGVVAFNSGFSKAILNDINPHIINFYTQIQSGEITPQQIKAFLTREGKKLALSGENGYEYYRAVRERFNNSFSPLDFLFLSRSGFNGMMRFSQKGKWNIPFCKKPNRFSQAYITKITNQSIQIKRAITTQWKFTCLPFQEILIQATENDLIYCDPPYLGRYVDYYNGWNEADEIELANLLSKTKANFILSTWHHNAHRTNETIDKYWSKFNIITKDHFYHSGGKIENRQSIVEALIFNFDIKDISPQIKEQDIKQLSLI